MRDKRLLIPLIIISSTIITLLSRQSASADSYLVTNTNNSGPGSLRQAITNANNHPGADTITFAASTNGSPIVLTGSSGENANATGDLDILDGGDLTIQGNGPTNTIIDGDGIDRVFHVCPGSGCSNAVTFNSVTIQNGVVGGGGGGIRNEAGTAVIDNCHIRSNTAINGGGISNFATLIIQNGSTIGGSGVGNHSIAGNGGGIYNYAGNLTIDGSNINANSADNNGGGIWNQATLNVQKGSIIGGTSTGNVATNNGGGIYNYGAGVVNVDGSTVSANTAERGGGGIHNVDFGIVTVASSIISNNSAGEVGGGIFNDAILNVQYGSIIGGTGKGNTADKGGGITNYGTTTVDSSTISANLANFGGGIHNDGTLNVQNDSIIGGVGAGNQAISSGGGIHNDYSGIMTVDDSTISANSANSGGGICNLASLTIQNGSIIGGDGAGNTANLNGGGIVNAEGITSINNSTVYANSADNGGGIANYGSTIVDSSTVSLNSATKNGGGIYTLFEGTTTVTGSRIMNNTAAADGGGVFSDIDLTEGTSVTGSCIVGNSYMAFFNNQPDWQIATGNWWGAATGPNSPGADTIFGNVDYSGFLTSPILNCASELVVIKSNDTGGIGTVGTPFRWTLTITNAGLIDATFGVSQKILEDDLPIGPSYGVPVAGEFIEITNSANIDCSLTGNNLTCEAASGNVTLGAVTGSFEVTISVIPNTTGSLVNPAGNCQVDPDGNVVESDESNNNCSPDVVNITSYAARLSLPLIIR